jgi:hypothetical protein
VDASQTQEQHIDSTINQAAMNHPLLDEDVDKDSEMQ